MKILDEFLGEKWKRDGNGENETKVFFSQKLEIEV